MSDIQQTEYGPMSESYLCAKLSELCIDKIGVQTGPFGSQLHKEDYVEVGTPIITVEHLGDNRIIHQDTPYVSDEDKNRLSKYHLQEGDIVFSRVGSVDRRALVRKDEDGWLFSGRCLRVRVDKSKIDPVYLSYFFGMKCFKNYIRSIAVGATMPSINTKILSDVPIYYPEDLDEQRRIAEVFYANDEKIELNRQTNQTLEQIAQAIFKSWFVDFEPVKAKIEAKQNGQDPERAAMRAISGKTDEELEQLSAEKREQLTATAALFPDELEDSELGEIPKGWELSTIGEEVEVAGGGTPSTKNLDFWEGGEIHWTSPKDLSGLQDKILLNTDKKITEAGLAKISSGLLPVDTVLMSSRAPVGYLAQAKIPVAINQGYIAMKCNKRLPPEFVLLWTDSVMDEIKQRASGSTFAEISKKNFRPITVVVPDTSILLIFQKQTKAIYDKITESISESTSLSKIRDSLLPKLLTGRLEVQG